MKLSLEELKELRDIASKSTRVVNWYPHYEEVRGPYRRWFTCTEVSDDSKKHVASKSDDCRFAAAAMNNPVPLLDLIEEQQRELNELRAEQILLGLS